MLVSKKNNKGFSLIELIVVVLIISIIAVALAPQVMKYIQTARVNVDVSNAGEIKSAAQAAAAHFSASGHNISTDAAISFEAGKVLTTEPTDGTLDDALYEDIGISTSVPAPAVKSDKDMNFWVVEYKQNGAIVQVYASSTNNASGKSSVIVA